MDISEGWLIVPSRFETMDRIHSDDMVMVALGGDMAVEQASPLRIYTCSSGYSHPKILSSNLYRSEF